MTDSTDAPTPLDVLEDEGTPTRADLGRRMGNDAQRVAAGELSEREFYEKYHDEVVDEFGFDHRPGGDE